MKSPNQVFYSIVLATLIKRKFPNIIGTVNRTTTTKCDDGNTSCKMATCKDTSGNKKWTGNDLGLLDGIRSAGVDAAASVPHFWRISGRKTLS